MYVCVMCVCLSVCGSCEPCMYVCVSMHVFVSGVCACNYVYVRDAFKQFIFPT